jgi:enolase
MNFVLSLNLAITEYFNTEIKNWLSGVLTAILILMDSSIAKVNAREILSASDSPTIETSVTLEDGIIGVASVPYGTSSGSYEAVTITDNDPNRYNGKGMLMAVKNVEEIIAPVVIDLDSLDQKTLDQKLLALDPTPRKENIGGNSILSVSLAAARAASLSKKVPLYDHIAQVYGLDQNISKLPKPMMVLMEGGVHADDATDFQEYLIAVTKDADISDCVRIGTEVYNALGKILVELGFDINVGLEGAYAATKVKTNTEPIGYLKEAIVKAGFKFGEDVNIALDPASSEFYEDGKYNLSIEKMTLSSDEFLAYYKSLIDQYGVFSIEDPFAEDDWDAWKRIFGDLGDKLKIVGDDLVVTNIGRLREALEQKTINSMIVKPNQVGTLTETMDAVLLAKEHNLDLIVSHRGGGETTDTFIIDLAVAIGAEFVKVGPSRGERTVKYNRLMEIGEKLNL